jgi:hypothetical protein
MLMCRGRSCAPLLYHPVDADSVEVTQRAVWRGMSRFAPAVQLSRHTSPHPTLLSQSPRPLLSSGVQAAARKGALVVVERDDGAGPELAARELGGSAHGGAEVSVGQEDAAGAGQGRAGDLRRWGGEGRGVRELTGGRVVVSSCQCPLQSLTFASTAPYLLHSSVMSATMSRYSPSSASSSGATMFSRHTTRPGMPWGTSTLGMPAAG